MKQFLTSVMLLASLLFALPTLNGQSATAICLDDLLGKGTIFPNTQDIKTIYISVEAPLAQALPLPNTHKKTPRTRFGTDCIGILGFATKLFCQVVCNHAYCVAGRAKQHVIIKTHKSKTLKIKKFP
jgi:hypothetical protein